MKGIITFLSLLSLLVSLPAPGSEPVLPEHIATAFEKYTAAPGSLVPILKGVTDKASADAAAPRLREALVSVYEARSALHDIKRLTKEQSQIVQERYALKMRQEWGLLYEQIARLRKARCYQSREFAQSYQIMCMLIER